MICAPQWKIEAEEAWLEIVLALQAAEVRLDRILEEWWGSLPLGAP